MRLRIGTLKGSPGSPTRHHRPIALRDRARSQGARGADGAVRQLGPAGRRPSTSLALGSALQRGRVCGLVKAKLAAAWQPERRARAPILFLDLRGGDPLPVEPRDRRGQVVAHEIEHGSKELVGRMALDEADAGRVDGELGWRQREDEPSVARVHAAPSERIAKEAPIAVGILAVDQEVSAGDRTKLLWNGG